MKTGLWMLVLGGCALALSGCKQACAADSDCDDSNACTEDHCASGVCSHQAVVLDDLNSCTQDACDPASGIQRTPVSVDDGNACTEDWCEPTAGPQHERIFTGACAATRLGFRTQPVAGQVGQAFVPPVDVEVRAADGGVVTLSTATVTLSLAPNDGGVALAGTLAVPAVNGVASFPNVHVDVAANGLKLVAKSPGLTSATSDMFNVYVPCATGFTRNGVGDCVDFCSTGSNPCTSPTASSCNVNTAVNYASPGTCTAQPSTPPYFMCNYSETDTPCVPPANTCQDPLTLRQFTNTCGVSGGVASCTTQHVDTDCSASSQVCRGAVCAAPPVINSVSPQVAAHGASVVLTGSALTGTSSVTIGGTSQTFTVDSDTQITVAHLDDASSTGSTQFAQVVNAGSSSNKASVTVIHLVVNELDTQQTGADTAEFVELTTGGVGSVSLAGYVLVFFDGATNASYLSIGLGGTSPLTTDPNGFFIVGNLAATAPAPFITFANGKLLDGVDAVAIYQGSVSDFPIGTAVTAAKLIDAVVYTGTANTGNVLLTSTLLIPAGQVEADENAHAAANTQSIQRCSTNQARQDGRAFGAACVGTPSPWMANTP